MIRSWLLITGLVTATIGGASLVVDEPAEITGPIGTYTVTVTTTSRPKITQGAGWIRIDWTDGITPPSPPTPVTPPPPVVGPPVNPTTRLSGPAWIAAVYDASKASSLTNGQQALLTDRTVASSLKALQFTWSTWGDPSDGRLKGWAQGVNTPCLVVIWNRGQNSQVYQLPADGASLIAFAKQLRGSN